MHVIMALMIISSGYPFKGAVFPGNMSEIDMIHKVIQSCAHRFNLTKLSIIFDRALVTNEYLNLIEDRELNFILLYSEGQLYHKEQEYCTELWYEILA